MKTPVILTTDDIRPELLMPEERKRFYEFYQKEIVPLEEFRKASLDKELYDNAIQVKEQEMYRKILSLTRPRMNTVDKLGRRILTPDEYIQRREACATQKERDTLNQTIVSTVTLGSKQDARKVAIDASLTGYIESLNAGGYVTGQSCSGILADHPNERYVQDAEDGRYINGECIMFNKQGSSAYLTFWKPEAQGVQTNTEEQIEDIRRIATAQGWIVEDTQVFYQPSICLRLPRTYDGSSRQEIFDEAKAITEELHPGLYNLDFMNWLEKRSPIIVQVEKDHGGVVMWSDEMIMQRWQKLAQSLVQVQEQREQRDCLMNQIDRISDVHVFVGGDGYYRIKCCIDGQKQLSERYPDYQRMQVRQGKDIKLVAAEIYEDKLLAARGQLQGLKR